VSACSGGESAGEGFIFKANSDGVCGTSFFRSPSCAWSAGARQGQERDAAWHRAWENRNAGSLLRGDRNQIESESPAGLTDARHLHPGGRRGAQRVVVEKPDRVQRFPTGWIAVTIRGLRERAVVAARFEQDARQLREAGDDFVADVGRHRGKNPEVKINGTLRVTM
jgi:hypothetical protein